MKSLMLAAILGMAAMGSHGLDMEPREPKRKKAPQGPKNKYNLNELEQQQLRTMNRKEKRAFLRSRSPKCP